MAWLVLVLEDNFKKNVVELKKNERDINISILHFHLYDYEFWTWPVPNGKNVTKSYCTTV